MSENYPGRPLTRREIRERELAAAGGTAPAAASAAPAPAGGPVPASPPLTRRSMHAPVMPQPPTTQVRPPSTTGGMRALDDTGRLTPVQRPTAAPVPATPAPAAPAAAAPAPAALAAGIPTRTTSRLPASGATPPQQAAFPRAGALPESPAHRGGPAAPSSGQAPSAGPSQPAPAAPFGEPGPSLRAARLAAAPAGERVPPVRHPGADTPTLGRSSRQEPSAFPPAPARDAARFGAPGPAGATGSERPAVSPFGTPAAPGPAAAATGAPFGTVAAPGAASPSASGPGQARVVGAASSPWAAGTGAAPAWGSITGTGAPEPGAPAAGSESLAPHGSLPPARPQPSPFDSFVVPDSPVRAAAAADQKDEDEYRPSSYTWLHYIILVVVAFGLGLMLWMLVAGEGPNFAAEAAPAAVAHAISDLPIHSRGIL